MKKLLIGIVLAAVSLGIADASGAGANARIAKSISAAWDMTGRIKGIHVLMSLRQEGNMYAGIYGGVNSAGKFSIVAHEDALTDELKVKSVGGFTLRLTNIPPRQGMDEIVPGQAWFKGVGGKKAEKTATIEFPEFTNWRYEKDPKQKEVETHKLLADFKAVLKVGDKKSEFSGTANFTIPAKVQAFGFDARATLNADDMGGPIQGPLQLRIRTKSPASSDKPVAPSDALKIDGLE